MVSKLKNPNSSSSITPKQLSVLQTIALFQDKHCYSATIEEIAQILGVSRPTVFEHVESLREKSLLEQSSGKARCLQATHAARKLLDQIQSNELDEAASHAAEHADSIQLCGYVCAGYGIEAVENQQSFNLSDLFGSIGNVFALCVKGQSMVNAGISDGDYIVCKSANTAENGQIVVTVLQDQQATLKRFFREKKYIRLKPENDSFEPIFSKDCTIQGVVIGLIRRL